MLKINPLSTLYVGIDVSSKSNYVYALIFTKINTSTLLFLIIILGLKISTKDS